jgi:hypothetical protein
MNRSAALFAIVLLVSPSLRAQSAAEKHSTEKRGTEKLDTESFLSALLRRDRTLQRWVHQDEIKKAARLGISYHGAFEKTLIGSDLPNDIAEAILRGEITTETHVETLEENYSRLTLSLPSFHKTYSFYFHQSKLISRLSYYTKNWNKCESRYFTVLAKDMLHFSPYCIRKLDAFTDSMLRVLQCSAEEKARLANGKIIYALCANEADIETLTGYQTNGIALLSSDAVASLVPYHTHELAHLLINFCINTKQNGVSLYTHPFFQEGFAVALGGRAEREAAVMLGLGSFLFRSGFLSVAELTKANGFYEQDASLSYPAAGLYNKFLLTTLGMEKYLTLYLKYSFTESAHLKEEIAAADLPNESLWQAYLNANRFHTIQPETAQRATTVKRANELAAPNGNRLMRVGEKIYAAMRDTLCLKLKAGYEASGKRAFQKLFLSRAYRGEKYVLIANEKEIALYNLWNGNLMALRAAAFSLPDETPSLQQGKMTFSFSAALLEEPFSELEAE